MSGIIGKKIGMTSMFDANGKNIACTVIEAGPCVVTQVRTKEKTVTKLFSSPLRIRKKSIQHKAMKWSF